MIGLRGDILSNRVVTTLQTFPVAGAEPGGDHAPSGLGRRQHDWTDWSEIDDPDVDDLSERVCLACGASEIAPTECLLPTVLLRRATITTREAA